MNSKLVALPATESIAAVMPILAKEELSRTVLSVLSF